ncbi:MAG: multiheme c-type cytochrome, partial [Planctomycetota bacterium]
FYSWQAGPHGGSYATLLQRYAELEQAGKAPDQRFTDNPQCLGCHVTGYAMPAGFADKQAELDQAQAAARKRRLERKLQALKPDDAQRAEVEEQLAELKQRDLGPFATLEGTELDEQIETLARALDARKHVGCECCHGGGRRHVAVAIPDRSAVANTPYQRDPASARSCERCHNGQRPCLPKGQADPFDRAAYLKKIQHWP